MEPCIQAMIRYDGSMSSSVPSCSSVTTQSELVLVLIPAGFVCLAMMMAVMTNIIGH
jgi:hypothetical protein